LIGRLYDLPVVIMEHSSEFPQKLVPRLHLWGARLAFKWANVVIPVSKSLQQGIQEYGIKARFSVIPNVVDTHLFYPDLSIHLRPQSKRILFVGLLDSSHKKGVPYLLNALIRLHKQRDEWYLEIVGDGPTRREYEQLAASLGILDRITFHGLKSREEVSKYMRQCDFVVLPSSYETFGVVLIEALASGKPVIATNCGGPVEIVAKEVGWVVPPQDVTALARAIDYMLDHCSDYAPEHLTEYVRQRFSYEAVGQALSRIYHDVLV
jgi:glycosyltransferase involved in cell wall biosynthesis